MHYFINDVCTFLSITFSFVYLFFLKEITLYLPTPCIGGEEELDVIIHPFLRLLYEPICTPVRPNHIRTCDGFTKVVEDWRPFNGLYTT